MKTGMSFQTRCQTCRQGHSWWLFLTGQGLHPTVDQRDGSSDGEEEQEGRGEGVWQGQKWFHGRLRISVGELSLQDEFVVLCRSISTHAGSKDLNQAPAVAGVLVDLFLVAVAGLASGTCPTFAEPDELVFVSGVAWCVHGATVDQIGRGVDYN